MTYPFLRNLKDINLVFTKAIPAAGASNQTDTIDLHQTDALNPGIREIQISIPAMAAHSAADKYLTITLQDSADDISYTDVTPGVVLSLVGVNPTGSVATEKRITLPSTIKRYVQFTQAETAAGPNLTATSVTYSLLV